MMPWALIINTFTNVLSELFLKLVCIIFYCFFYVINFMFRNPAVFCKFNLRLKPKFCFIFMA